MSAANFEWHFKVYFIVHGTMQFFYNKKVSGKLMVCKLHMTLIFDFLSVTGNSIFLPERYGVMCHMTQTWWATHCTNKIAKNLKAATFI